MAVVDVGVVRVAVLEAPVAVRRMHDLELFLDKLALIRPSEDAVAPAVGAGGDGSRLPAVAKKNVMTFAPEGARGVAAYVDERKVASA